MKEEELEEDKPGCHCNNYCENRLDGLEEKLKKSRGGDLLEKNRLKHITLPTYTVGTESFQWFFKKWQTYIGFLRISEAESKVYFMSAFQDKRISNLVLSVLNRVGP
jgi:hypothetical protein